MIYNKDDVLKYMPHRDPFLFIDSVESIKGGKDLIDGEILISTRDLIGIEVVANYYTDPKHLIFKGHFPGMPILPGVVQVEMMAQTGCFCMTKLHENPLKAELEVALMGATDAKFRRPVLPDMHLKIHANCSKARGPILNIDCQLFHEFTLMSEVKIMASVKFK